MPLSVSGSSQQRYPLSPHTTEAETVPSSSVRNDHAHPSAHATAATLTAFRPGSNPVRINGQTVARTAVSKNGFFSAFSLPPSAALIRQSAGTEIQVVSMANLLQQMPAISAHASQQQERYFSQALSRHPSLMQRFHHQTLHYLKHLDPEQKHAVSEALHIYQNEYGDNYLMNVNVMGFQSLKDYLAAIHQRPVNENDLDDFVMFFAENYSIPEDDDDEMEATKTHIEDALHDHTAILADFLHNAPPVSGITVQKGTKAENSLYNTTLNSNQTLRRLLSGDALMFNGFLSTSANVSTAIEFSGIGMRGTLGNAIYAIDLTRNNSQNQALKQVTLNKLRNENWNPEHVIFSMATHNARGVDVDALQDALDEHSLSNMGEQEILFAPGHCLQPESITVCDNGCVIRGTLSYPRAPQ